MADYAVLIFGSVDEVRRLSVQELKERMAEKAMLPDELDQILSLGPEWPRIAELLADYRLFTEEMMQRAFRRLFGDAGRWDDISLIHNLEVQRIIHKYLVQHPQVAEEALAQFKSEVKSIHITNYAAAGGLEEYVRKGLTGEKLPDAGSPNLMSPLEYAETYVYSSVLRETNELKNH